MMEKIFQHNGWLKVFSVALSILLWAMVMPNYTADTFRVFDIPLIVYPHQEYDVLEGPRDRQVTVQVRAEGKNLIVSRLRKEDFKAVLDYRKVTEPGKSVPLEVEVVEAPERVGVTVTPKTFTVTLVEQKSATFPLAIEPADQDEITFEGRQYRYQAKLETNKVEITGRSDFLDRVKYARVYLDEKALVPTNTRLERVVTPVDAAGRTVDLKTPPVTVHLTWEPLPPGKPFKVQPIFKGSPAPGYSLISLTPEQEAVTVRAATLEGKLPEREVVETEPIDLTGKTQTFAQTVRLVPPPGTTIVTQTVTVTVTIQEQTIERVFKSVPISVVGKATNAEVTLTPSEAQVRLKGPYSAVNRLDASALNVHVDVEGTRDGTFPLPVKVPTPPGVVQLDVDPAYVDVTITAR